jgi:hypothetical protein
LSIAPPSDIVLDVAQAADPQRLQAATERLARLAAGAPAGSEEFGMALQRIRVGAAASASTSSPPKIPDDRPTHAITAMSRSPYQKFESMVLQNFVEAMLPRDDALFGDAASAGAYRSMLADQLATQLARTGKLGIAKVIEKAEDHKAAADHTKSLAAITSGSGSS